MQYVMVDRKLCGIFGFSCMFAKNVLSYYFSLFRSLHVWRKQQKTKTETEKAAFLPFLPENVPFCRK